MSFAHLTAAVALKTAEAQWLERSPSELDLVGSIPDRVIPKT